MAISTTASAPAARLVALDAFRGLTMAAMVIVNNPGDWSNVYAPLLHAPWHGWTPTDLIFPFFLFIVGVSVTLSRSTLGSPWRIVRRALVIFGLGLFLAGFPYFNLKTIRIPGVLQRIAVCYLVTAFIYRLALPSAGRVPLSSPDAVALARKHATRLLAAAVALTVGYWLVIELVPPPGGVAGDLTPDGNLGAHIDRAVFGGHLWRSSKTWDPEGLLSTIPAVGSTLLGGVAGLWLGVKQPASRKAAWLALGGIGCVAVGLAWSAWFPINKSLWTSSYTWFTAGAAALLLAACIWAIDARGWRAWSWPFVILGLNAITLFVLSGLLAKTMGLVMVNWGGRKVSFRTWVYSSFFQPAASPKNASLLFAAANLAFLFAVLYLMHRKKLYLRA
ncbi:MAG: acyltransferase family protein [Vicinamibacterales bacterium]